MSNILEENMKAYDRELKFALDISEAIPILVVEQDLRSKNRYAEHSKDGCKLVNLGNVSHRQPNHNLFSCDCGWTGWLIPKEELDDA